MNQKSVRAILIDFFALSGTGKSTHSKALFDHLTSEGFKVEMLSFTLRRNGKNGSFKELRRQPLSALFKSISMGRAFLRISPRKSSIADIFYLMKWSYRLLGYDKQIRSHVLEDVDYLILDPSLSSKLKKFYKYFDEHSFVNVVSILEENKLMSDIIINIEADIAIVKKRRLDRGSPEQLKGDSATFSIRKAFREAERQNSPTNFLTVGYDCFSSLENNIQQIAELCVHTRSQLSSSLGKKNASSAKTVG